MNSITTDTIPDTFVASPQSNLVAWFADDDGTGSLTQMPVVGYIVQRYARHNELEPCRPLAAVLMWETGEAVTVRDYAEVHDGGRFLGVLPDADEVPAVILERAGR